MPARIVVGGGDGTLSCVVNQLDTAKLLSEVELALLPTGTGNDFARSIGVFNCPLEEAFAIACEGEALAVDLICVRNGCEQLLVNAATAGFGGLASSDVTSVDKQRFGAMAYWVTAFTRLVAMQEYRLVVETDSQNIEVEAFGMAINSGRYVGGGFPVSPSAIVNDGLLDVTIVPKMPLSDVLGQGVSFSLGLPSDQVICLRTTSVHVKADPILPYSFDGEGKRSLEATFEVLPSAMRIVVGPSPVAVQVSS
jgi:YegS/Rv2252/BmrU family lipid kinase